MTKRNEQMQRMAEQYWRKVESGGMAYELAPQTLVVGSFRDGLKSGLAAHRAEILKLERKNAALREDKARLDSGTILLTVGGERVHHVAVDLRAAIDAARKEAQP